MINVFYKEIIVFKIEQDGKVNGNAANQDSFSGLGAQRFPHKQEMDSIIYNNAENQD
jgi:hypothetical protein